MRYGHDWGKARAMATLTQNATNRIADIKDLLEETIDAAMHAEAHTEKGALAPLSLRKAQELQGLVSELKAAAQAALGCAMEWEFDCREAMDLRDERDETAGKGGLG